MKLLGLYTLDTNIFEVKWNYLYIDYSREQPKVSTGLITKAEDDDDDDDYILVVAIDATSAPRPNTAVASIP